MTGPQEATRHADAPTAAFFDLDNTMIRGASIFHFARGLAARDLLTARDIARYALRQAAFRIRGEDPNHICDARDSALAFVKGYRTEQIAAIGEEVFDNYMADKIWTETREIADAHLAAGRRVWLITAAPIELASVVTRRLGFTGALGTVSETDAGTYTGRLVGDILHGEAKADAVRELAERERLDLSGCYAYSDSANDIPMLSLVGNPCVVNPDPRLARHAREHGWEIHDHRASRRAARFGLPTAAVLALGGGGVAVSRVLRRTGEPAS